METQPIKIILIDDHRSVLWGLEKLIESEKPRMKVIGTATNSAEALKLVSSITPDLIMIDLDLNGESGVDIIPKLAQLTPAKILVLTGTRDIALRDRAMLAGARGIVEKSDTAESILKAIDTVFNGEVWLDRTATSRIFNELSRKKSGEPEDPDHQKISTLTRKERQTIEEICKDATSNTKMLASKLCISESTLRNHLSSIYAKLGLSSRLELFVYASKHGLDQMEK